MSRSGRSRLRVVGALCVILGLVTAACGGSKSSSGTASSGDKKSGSSASVKPGAAGIASKARDIGGLIKLDDGEAMWKTRPASESRVGVTKTEVVLGAHMPLSGPLAAIAEKPGFEAIVNAVNEAGGIHGRKIVLKIEDNGANPAKAVPAVQKLVQEDKVFGIVGGQITAAQQAVMGSLAQQGIPDIAPNSMIAPIAEPTVKTRIAYGPSGQLFGYATGKYILETYPKAKVAYLYQNDSYGRDSAGGVKYSVEKGGGTAVADVPFNLGASADFTSAAQQLVNSKPDVIFVEAQFPQAVPFMKALRGTLGSKIPVVFGNGQPEAYLTGDSPDFDGATGFIYEKPFSDYSIPINKVAKDFFEKAGVTYKGGPALISYLAVAQMSLMLRAMELAGPDLTREGLMEAFEKGFTGDWSCSVCVGPAILGPEDHWAGESLQLVKWDNASTTLKAIGQPVSYETSQGKGLRQTAPELIKGQ
ncbi:MAG TPA: ABC transporter substrate-binding protein [Acidimicrobiales bacterium]|nr:ABC transporter substrate-binding protein [Acidimicrobiales bacterium]